MHFRQTNFDKEQLAWSKKERSYRLWKGFKKACE
jgi:hypothetical protein